MDSFFMLCNKLPQTQEQHSFIISPFPWVRSLVGVSWVPCSVSQTEFKVLAGAGVSSEVRPSPKLTACCQEPVAVVAGLKASPQLPKATRHSLSHVPSTAGHFASSRPRGGDS